MDHPGPIQMLEPRKRFWTRERVVGAALSVVLCEVLISARLSPSDWQWWAVIACTCALVVNAGFHARRDRQHLEA